MRSELFVEKSFPRLLRSFVVWQLGAWVACIALVVLVALGYRSHAEHRREKLDRRACGRKLALEVAFRTQVYQKIKEEEQNKRTAAARKVLDGERDLHVMYPEFTGRPLISLLWELARTCDEEETKRSLMTQVGDLRVTGSLTIRSDLPEGELDKQVRSLRGALAEFLRDNGGRLRSAASADEGSVG